MPQAIVDHIYSSQSNLAVELETSEMKRTFSFGNDWNELVLAILIGLDGTGSDPIPFPELPFTGMGMALMSGTTKGMFQSDPTHLYYAMHGINSNAVYTSGGSGVPARHLLYGTKVGRRTTNAGVMVDEAVYDDNGCELNLLAANGASQALGMYFNKTTNLLKVLRFYTSAYAVNDYSLDPAMFWSGLETLNWGLLKGRWETSTETYDQRYVEAVYDLAAATPDLSYDEATHGDLDSVSVWWVPFARKLRVLEVGAAKWS